jgi:hypothetical protein
MGQRHVGLVHGVEGAAEEADPPAHAAVIR